MRAAGLAEGAGSWRRERRERRRHGLDPVFEVVGTFEVGDGVVIARGPIRTQVSVTRDGVCTIGDGVFIGHGSSISCDRRVAIGARTRLGQFSVIYDSDFHTAGAHDLRRPELEAEAPPPKTGPVEIGADVLIGVGTTILRGTIIGDGAVVEPSSVLWGTIPPAVRVIGNPKNVVPL